MNTPKNCDKVLRATSDIEDLISDLEQIVVDLRSRPDDIRYAYSRTYKWRQAFGARVVARLGFGKPMVIKEEQDARSI
jgi:hypothetical protein